MPIQTPGYLELKSSISNAFLKPVLKGLEEIKDEKIKKETEKKAQDNIDVLSESLAKAIDEYIVNMIVTINAGIPVAVKIDNATIQGETIDTGTS
jgi:hypothetical protein